MWALYPWFDEHGTEKVHPQDLTAFRALGPYGKVFRVGAPEPPFVVLEYGAGRYRVDPSLLKEVTDPGFAVGDPVVLEDGTRGEVAEVGWHHQKAEPIFFLNVGGKRKSRRYGRAELSPA
jgi:hypothetical protein